MLKNNVNMCFEKTNPELYQKWKNNTDKYLRYLCNKWSVNLTGFEKKGRFGLVFYGYSKDFGKIVLKIIPSFYDRLYNEINSYKFIPYHEMCPLLDYDTNIGALLLKYIKPEETSDVFLDTKILFNSLFLQKQKSNDIISLPSYIEKNKSRMFETIKLISLEEKNDIYKSFISDIELSLDIIHYFDNDVQYILHGDIHKYNILKHNNSFSIIDPIGVIGPFEFELVRCLGTLIKEKDISINDFLEYISLIEMDYKKLIVAMIIDSTVRSCNTFFEGNADKEIREAIKYSHNLSRYLINQMSKN